MIKVASVFAQVLSLINRRDFCRAVAEVEAEKAAKGFRCWEQFVCMLFCHLASADSLREICGGLASSMGKMVHLGIKRMPKRSHPTPENMTMFFLPGLWYPPRLRYQAFA